MSTTRSWTDRDARPMGRQLQESMPREDRSLRIVRVASAGLMAIACWLLLVPSASALYVDTSAPFGSSSVVDLQIGDHSISVLDEIKTIEVRNDEHGIRLRFKVAFKTIEFNDGPVLLDRVDFGAGVGKAVAVSSDGPVVVTGGRSVNRMVSRLRVAGRSNVLAARGIHVEIPRPISTTQPVPEPGAALLFATGLLAVGIGTRKQA